MHIYQLVRHLSLRGHDVVTLGDDPNPHTKSRPKTPWGVISALRSADVVYCRVTDTPNPATRLTLPPYVYLVPNGVAVVWEFNTSILKNVAGVTVRDASQVDADVDSLRRAASRVDSGICVTNDLAGEIRTELNIEPLTVIPNGSDPSMFNPSVQLPEGWDAGSDTFRVAVAASGRDAHHDLDLVAEIGAEIERRRLPIELHILGEPARQFRRSEGGAFRIHGPIPYTQMPAYLAGCDVGLALYNERVDYGSPLKLFDYLASGSVPICSESSSVRDVIEGTNSGFVGDWSATGVVDLLVRLLGDDDLRSNMQQTGRRLVTDRYNWEEVARLVEEVMIGAVSGPSVG